VRRKQPAHRTPRGYTRVELAAALSCSRATVERLIAAGLEPIGYQGKAHLYRLSDARRLRRQLAGKDQVPDDVRLEDYASNAEDLRDRTEQLRREWLADGGWLPHWRAVVSLVSRVTSSWPATLADRLGAFRRDQQDIVGWADGPRVLPPQPADCLGPEAFAAWRTRCAELSARPGLVRPLLEDAAAALRAAGSLVALGHVLAVPSPARPSRRPRSVDQARDAWRQARADYRRQRVAIRRGHHRRAEVVAAVASAISAWKFAWWGARGQLAPFCADRAGALAFAEQLRVQTLKRLATLADMVPVEPVPSERRTTPRKGGSSCRTQASSSSTKPRSRS